MRHFQGLLAVAHNCHTKGKILWKKIKLKERKRRNIDFKSHAFSHLQPSYVGNSYKM